MSRTACCFLALGISVAAFAAACGDDDGGGGGTGGNGGSGASGGSGGSNTAGSAGSAGTAGGAGSGGDAGGGAGGGTAGTGNAGAGGSAAGAGGTSGGTAGAGTVEPDGGVPDSGVVDEPDSGVIVDAGNTDPVDSGVNGDCAGFTTGIANIDAPNNQDVVISRVIFNNDDTTATVILRVVATGGFTFGGGQQLCWGATDEECVEVDDNVGGPAAQNTQLAVVIGTGDSPVAADEGEVLFTNDFATANPDITFAYLNWGNHDSADPAGAAPTLETLAGDFWTPGDSVVLTGAQNAIFVDTTSGDTTTEAGFGVCTADEF